MSIPNEAIQKVLSPPIWLHTLSGTEADVCALTAVSRDRGSVDQLATADWHLQGPDLDQATRHPTDGAHVEGDGIAAKGHLSI